MQTDSSSQPQRPGGLPSYSSITVPPVFHVLIDGLVVVDTPVSTARSGKYTPRGVFQITQKKVDKVSTICDTLYPEPDIGSILITVGRFNILVIALFNDLDRLHALASDKILALPGVHHVETAIGINTVKYDVRIARIL